MVNIGKFKRVIHKIIFTSERVAQEARNKEICLLVIFYLVNWAVGMAIHFMLYKFYIS